MNRIPYKKARMLKYWSGRSTSHTASSYDIESYGHSLIGAANEFLDKGLLRISLPSENVEKATIPELKQFLKSVGEKLTGSKPELCQRIIFKFSDEQLASFFNNSFYVLTDSGNQQLSLNSAFFLNDRFYCSLTESEINNAIKLAPELPDYKILTDILSQKLPTDFKQNEFDTYKRQLRSLYCICIDYEEYKDAVLYLWLYLYNELSGLHKPWYSEILPRVDDIQCIRLDSQAIEKLDECISLLEWDLIVFKEYITNQCVKITPDYVFHYYSIENALSIICDQLTGINFSPTTCNLPHSTPITNSENYKYYTNNYEYTYEPNEEESADKISNANNNNDTDADVYEITENKEPVDEMGLIMKNLTELSYKLVKFFAVNNIKYEMEKKVNIYTNCFEVKFKFKSEHDIQLINRNHAIIAKYLDSPMLWTKKYDSLVTSFYIVYTTSFYNDLIVMEIFKSLKWYPLSI